jgi:hypothetical protein
MTFVSTILKELLGLFVDDGSLAIGIFIWIALVAGLVKIAALSPAFCGVLLFVGLGALLLENVWRTAGK